MEGSGKLTFNNGSVFQGSFVNDKIFGEGMLTLREGKIFKGKFMKD